MPEIVFSHVTKRLQKNEVLTDVSLSMKSGEITGLKGANGSGKTMLMRLVAGLIYASDGTVSVGGRVLGREETFPESIGVLIENPAFLNGYSGFQNLKMLASIRGLISDDRIDEVLRLVGLYESRDKKFKKYSLGMKQRLGIAAAIMERPALVLLDEPTNALDDDGVRLVRDLILAEKARGATVLVSCHDFSLLRSVADTVFVMEAGRVTGCLTAQELLQKEADVL